LVVVEMVIFFSGVSEVLLEGEDPEKKFDIRDPSDMAIPPLRAKARGGKKERDDRNYERSGG
jgi:hypothetical protein